LAIQFTDLTIEILRGIILDGYEDEERLYADPDFANLNNDPRFLLLFYDQIQEFWIADREVSRCQFELFVNDASHPKKEKPESWKGVDRYASPTADHPAQKVSWSDAVLFCNWLSLQEGRKPCYERTFAKEKMGSRGKEDVVWRLVSGATGYRLLSETEWEYACRAGTETQYSMGSDKALLARYCQMAPAELTALCGDKLPNGWGLYDMHGNVWEWCETIDNRSASGQVYRGGSWDVTAAVCGSAYRFTFDPTLRANDGGFRLALNPSQASQTTGP
jgi:formylglycine-generating enzyme required for sulfatase activity